MSEQASVYKQFWNACEDGDLTAGRAALDAIRAVQPDWAPIPQNAIDFVKVIDAERVRVCGGAAGGGKSYIQKMGRYLRATAVVSAKAPEMRVIAFNELLGADYGKLEERILATLPDKARVLNMAMHTGAPGGLGIVADLPTSARMGCPWRADGPSPRPHPGDQGPSYGPHKDRGHPRA